MPLDNINWIPFDEIMEELINDNPDLFRINNDVNKVLKNKYDTWIVNEFINIHNISKQDYTNAYYNFISWEKSENKILNELIDLFQKIEDEQNTPISYFINYIDLFYVNTDFLDKFYSIIDVSENEKNVINKFVNKKVIWELNVIINWKIMSYRNCSISNEDDNFINVLSSKLDEYLRIQKIWEWIWKKIPWISFSFES